MLPAHFKKGNNKTMKKIEMREDKKGSEDGVTVTSFNKGQTYMVADELAGVFIANKWAVDMDTPENLEKERLDNIKKLGEELVVVVNDCLSSDLDSVQMQERIDTLKAHSVTEDIFQEKFKAAEDIKAKGIKDAEKSLKTLNKANANKDR